MSKKSKARASYAEKARKKREREEFEAKKRKVRKITAIVTITFLLLLVLTALSGLIAYQVRLNRGEYLRQEIAAASAQIEVDGAMMNYYFNDIYNTFVDYYGSYVEYYGLDTTLPLRSQYIDSTESWFDYLMSGAKSTVSNLLALNEAAEASGTALSEQEIAAIRSRADRTDEGLYGRGVNTDDIYRAKLLEALAYKQQFAKEDEFEPDDDEIQAYFEAHAENFQKIDYLAFPLYYSDTSMSEEEVQEWAEKLAAAQSPDDFLSICTDILLYEDPTMSDTDLASELSSTSTTGALYSSGDSVSEWAFAAASGDTMILPDTENTQYTVYYLTQEAYCDISDTINIRHIFLSDSTYEDRDGALTAAEALLDEWKADGASIEAFALLALEYSEDVGSYYHGGHYTHLSSGQIDDVLDEWCFDEARKVGDIGILETDYGVHILYYEEQSLARWKASVSDQIVSEKISTYLAEIAETYPVVFDENVLDMIPD